MTTTTLTDDRLPLADWYGEQDGGEEVQEYLLGQLDVEDRLSFLASRCRLGLKNQVRMHVGNGWEWRADRDSHPEGTFDKAARWYPSEDENADEFTLRVRSPSRSWPYSFMTAARTKKHVRALLLLFAFGETSRVPADLKKEADRLRTVIVAAAEKVEAKLQAAMIKAECKIRKAK